MKFKFSHIADCHIGGWRDPRMSELSIEAFEVAINTSLNEKVDFVIIAGDLFNNAIPGIEAIKSAVSSLNKLKKKNIPCYFIPGSHDYSANGKTFLDVIEEAGLGINVFKASLKDNRLSLKFTIDEKTGVKLAGILGRKGQLDKNDYEILDYKKLEKEDGFKIFLFHTTISEMKPKFMEFADSLSVHSLPTGFDYYAGGHVHIVEKFESPKYKNVIYPGPLFPNSFSEIEKLKQGGFYIVNVNDKEIKTDYKDIKLKETATIEVNANNMSSEELNKEIYEKIDKKYLEDCIVLIRIYGTLSSGRISDINFSDIISKAYAKGAYFIMRNTSKLLIEETDIMDIDTESSEEVEQSIINKNQGSVDNKFIDEYKAIIDLMNVASSEKIEGEKVYDYESRILSQIESTIQENIKGEQK
jgi:hypothetical protein